MTILFVILVLAALVAFYVVWGRPWLRSTALGARILNWIEPIELALWQKSETILFARFLQIVGFVTTLMGYVGTIDWTLITPLVPDKYQKLMPLIPLALNLIGGVVEKLRRDTTKPLEIVATPEAVKAATPEIVAAETMTEAAVVAVKEAKAEGGA